MTTTPSPPRAAADLTRQRLLTAAEALVVGQGVHALSVRRIAAAAGVNSALIRYHFGGTDGLLRELALRNAGCIAARRAAILAAGPADFARGVDALVEPLWAPAAMDENLRAMVVLDEIFARAAEALHREVWAALAEGVAEVTRVLAAALPAVDAETLRWRVRFVTAAALDVPPRRARVTDRALRLEQFRRFAAHALSASPEAC